MQGEPLAEASTPTGAVFLSYASQDAEAAKRICEALRAAGVEVWFDQSGLRGGDAWDQEIRNRIRDCALFVPIISSNTNARTEGYFRLEWKLAVDRSHLIADDAAFLVPIVIDATAGAAPRVPERFRQLQWTNLPGAEVTPEFLRRIRRLLNPVEEHTSGPSADARFVASDRPQVRPRLWLALKTALVVVATIAAWLYWRHAATGGAASTPPEKSIAVLPFVDLSERHDQEYFSDGLAEELLDLLAQIPDLKVPARTSSFYFRGRQVTVAQIAQTLGVQNLLEGSVRKSGDRIRVTVQLIRAQDGFQVWSKTFDRDLKDVFAVQDEIANAVLDTLKAKFQPAEGLIGARQTSNVEAHEMLLLGRQRYYMATGASDLEAMDFFRRAIKLDPGYATAYAYLAQTIGSHAVTELRRATPEEYQQRTQLLDRAVELAPNLGDAYAVRSINRMMIADWKGAQADLTKAVELDPHNSRNLRYLSRYHASQGELPMAVETINRAIALDPLDPYAFTWRASYQAAMANRSAARGDLQRALVISPKYTGAALDLAFLDAIDGRSEAALARVSQMPPSLSRDAVEMAARCAAGEKSTKTLDQAVAAAGEQSLQMAIAAYAACGGREQALALLERTLTGHIELLGDFTVETLKYSISFQPLHNEPRFKALLQRLKLPE
jgi:TolB-like protein/Flp pilus assembly protein TadD